MDAPVAVEEASAEPKAPTLSTARIFAFYRPLALSWLLMAVESPISVGIIARRPDPELHTAAFLIMMSLSLWIESPVIDLLATATTLGRDHASYRVLRRFVGYTMAFVTLVHGAIVYTPLYPIVTEKLLSTPPDVAAAARPGLMILLFWSACIGWRRYLQGIMIRFGATKFVGRGTMVRLVTLTTVGLTLHFTTKLDGIVLTACSLACSVFSEALYATWASRRVIQTMPETEPGSPPLGIRRLMAFHWPLSATTMLVLISNPIVSQALAQSPNPKSAMASWQVAAATVWLLRTAAYALPEVVIALYQPGEIEARLRRFCVMMGMVTSGTLFAVHAVGLDDWVFRRLLDVEASLIPHARLAFLLCGLLPMIGALQSYVRGMLTAHHLTTSRLWAIAVGLFTLLATLRLGVGMQWTGVVTAAAAMTTSLLAELAVLAYAWRQGRAKLNRDVEAIPA